MVEKKSSQCSNWTLLLFLFVTQFFLLLAIVCKYVHQSSPMAKQLPKIILQIVATQSHDDNCCGEIVTPRNDTPCLNYDCDGRTPPKHTDSTTRVGMCTKSLTLKQANFGDTTKLPFFPTSEWLKFVTGTFESFDVGKNIWVLLVWQHEAKLKTVTEENIGQCAGLFVPVLLWRFGAVSAIFLWFWGEGKSCRLPF